MKKYAVISFAVLCFLVIQPGIPSAEASGSVSQIVNSFYTNNGPAGLSVSVRQNGRTLTYCRGYANLETKDRVTKESVFRIASVSKLFTALAILKLKEQGKLSLDDAISRYVPGFPYGDLITIRNMLQHTSGIPNFADFEQFSANQAKEWKPAELIDLLRVHLSAQPLDFEPGTKAAYSNSNFMLLAAVVEAASSVPFKDFVDKQVTAPLGMTATGVGSDAEIVPHRAAGYIVEKGEIANAAFVSVVAPFGTGDFMSRPNDLIKVSRAFKPGVLLSQATIDEMSRPVVLKDGTTWIGSREKIDYSFGYCWELVKPEGAKDWIYTKGGAISGFFAHVLYFRKPDLAIAISSNAQGNFKLLDLGLQIGRALGALR